MIDALVKYLLYPLALKAVGYLYEKYIEKSVEDNYNEREKSRDSIIKAISGAKTNEERRNLSIALADLSKLSDP